MNRLNLDFENFSLYFVAVTCGWANVTPFLYNFAKIDLTQGHLNLAYLIMARESIKVKYGKY